MMTQAKLKAQKPSDALQGRHRDASARLRGPSHGDFCRIRIKGKPDDAGKFLVNPLPSND